MKKEKLTNKLAFNKAAVTELDILQLQSVNGGTITGTIFFPSIIIYTGGEDGPIIKITN